MAMSLWIKDFISRLTSERIDQTPLSPGMTRDQMRVSILNRLAFVRYSHHTELRGLNDIRIETVEQYGPRVDRFMDEHLDLIAEIRLLGGVTDAD